MSVRVTRELASSARERRARAIQSAVFVLGRDAGTRACVDAMWRSGARAVAF
jgi:hypothetical protein